jgi:nucleotide-binding universal stress UspA family protein
VPGRIVVGVDGSPPSITALRWGAAEAQLRQATLVALHAWTFVVPAPTAEPGLIGAPPADFAGSLEAFREAAEAELREAIEKAFKDGPPLEIEQLLVEESAGEALVAAGEDADLLVVGSSGKSGLASVLLGSVSKHAITHASCPVCVVRERKS